VDERPYLIDAQSDVTPSKPDDAEMTTAASDTALKSAQLSVSRSRNSDSRTTTTLSDIASKPAELSTPRRLRNNDSEMASASSEIAAQPALFSSSRLRSDDNEMTTTTRNREASLSKARHTASQMTPVSSSTRATTAALPLSNSHSTDAEIAVRSTVQSAAQEAATINKTEDNTTKDIRVPADEVLDAETSVRKSQATVDADAMDVSELKETSNDNSPSVCNRKLKVNLS